jgi:mono/diheme cytochrome c family protein
MVQLDFLRNKINEVQSMTHRQVRMLPFSLLGIGLLAICAGPSKAQSAAETVYKAKCAMCHGPDGKGETPAGKSMKAVSFAAPEVAKMSDEELETVITKGKNKMPAFDGKLKKEQIEQLVEYIRALAKKLS